MLAVSPLINAYAQSDFLGKCIFIALFGLSVITWVIFLHKLRITKSVKKEGQKIQDFFQKKRLNPLNLDTTALGSSQEIQPFLEIYRVLKTHTIELLNKNKLYCEEKMQNKSTSSDNVYLSSTDMDLIEAHLITTISTQSKQLEKNLFILSTVVTLAPFLGLLGTVWGILDTFAVLQSQNGGNANELVMGGLSMALGTTVIGLIVAIPALIAYNYLRSSIEHSTIEMEDFSNILIASVEMQYRKVDVQ